MQGLAPAKVDQTNGFLFHYLYGDQLASQCEAVQGMAGFFRILPSSHVDIPESG
jgi:hypothetical protein